MEALRKSLLQKKPVQAVDDNELAETNSSRSDAKLPKTNASSKATATAAAAKPQKSVQPPARKKARSA